jgi:hypothetical protein
MVEEDSKHMQDRHISHNSRRTLHRLHLLPEEGMTIGPDRRKDSMAICRLHQDCRTEQPMGEVAVGRSGRIVYNSGEADS